MTKPLSPAPRREIDLVPLNLFSQRIAEGWQMVVGYPLEPGDFAVTMSPPGWSEPRSNRSRGRVSRRSTGPGSGAANHEHR